MNKHRVGPSLGAGTQAYRACPIYGIYVVQ